MGIGWSGRAQGCTLTDAALLAEQLLDELPDRWSHVSTVGTRAEQFGGCPVEVRMAAWLHDIGYSPVVQRSEMHAVDGAAALRDWGWPAEVVSLVAYHSGAIWEAEARGVSDWLDPFEVPADDHLAMLTYLDMTSGPTGEVVSPTTRLDEILRRYPRHSPVHRSVQSHASLLIAMSEHGKVLLADAYGGGPVKGVCDSDSH